VNPGLGYIPDVEDERDLRFGALRLPGAILSSCSMRDHVVEVLNQENTSACVAHSWAQALRMADMFAGVKEPPLPSREFLYYNSRAFDGEPIQDQGTQLRSCAKGLIKFGRPPESSWAFDPQFINERPPWSAYRDGYDYKGPAGYYRVIGLDEIKAALASGKPVVGGTSVGNSIFEYTSGIYSPSPTEPSVGGHALTFTGYTPTYFEICGSWGPGYGEQGFMRVSYEFAASFTDCWAVH
jgi:C1A family cysteine protease